MLPNFIIFGTRKAGTSSLYNYLFQHPQVFMPSLKGTRYFLYDPAKEEQGENIPIKTLAEYESLFEKGRARGAIAIGEASPTYINSKDAAARIKAVIPGVKLIASLRNPIERTYSHYLMSVRKIPNKDRPPLTIDNVHKWSSAGLYFEALKEYYALFPSDQIKIMIFEKWIKDIKYSLVDLYGFLGVDNSFFPDLATQYNKGGVPKSEFLSSVLSHKPIYIKLKPYIPSFAKRMVNRVRNLNMKSAEPMGSHLREYLRDYFREDQKKLAELIGQDLSIWEKPATK